MTATNPPVRIALAEAFARLPTEGARHARLLTRGDLQLDFYAPRGKDDQTPHERDELYVVVSGGGMFALGPSLVPFAPGDVLLVPAGVEHRFQAFSDDLAVWVIFFGPEGGLTPESAPQS